jgi:hypothetical protein
MSEKMIKNFQISLVIHGNYKYKEYENSEDDPYQVPKKLGIFKVL